MKVGMRKPSLKKSISARTTGKMKRSVKKAVNPLYGKKGMGYINNPKKAVYNKVYNKTTVGVGDAVRVAAGSSKSAAPTKPKTQQPKTTVSVKPQTTKPAATSTNKNTHISKGMTAFLIFISILLILSGILLIAVSPIAGILAIGFGIFCIVYANKHKK